MSNNDDLWKGHGLEPTNALDTALAIQKAASILTIALDNRDTANVLVASRWLKAIANALDDLVEAQEEYDLRR